MTEMEAELVRRCVEDEDCERAREQRAAAEAHMARVVQSSVTNKLNG